MAMSYWKPKGKAAGHGLLYEKLNCMRLLQALENQNEDFCFAYNMDNFKEEKDEKIGEFDDIICKVFHDSDRLQFLFVQLKHSINEELIITEEEKNTDKKYKSKSPAILENFVMKCYKSFVVIRNLFETKTDDSLGNTTFTWGQFFNCKFDECDIELVYFTNRKVSDEVEKNLEKTDKISSLLASILNSRGSCYTIPHKTATSQDIDFQKICNESDDDAFSIFATSFRICVGQFSNAEIETQIKENMINFKKEIIYSGLRESLEKWYNKYGSVDFLTLNDHFFNNYGTKIYKEDHCDYIDFKSKIEFCTDYLQKLTEKNRLYWSSFNAGQLVVLTSLIMNIFKYLNVMRIEDYVSNSEVLVIDSDINLELLERTLRTKCSYNTLFVFVNSVPETKFFEILKQFTQQEGKTLHTYFENQCLNNCDATYFQRDHISFSFDQLAAETQNCYFEKQIKFQGIETTLGTVFKDIPQLINVEMFSKLAGGLTIQVGDKMRPMGAVSAYYVPRHFIVCSVDYFLVLMKQNTSDIHIVNLKRDIVYNKSKVKDSNCCIITSDDFEKQCESYPDRNVHLFELHETSINYKTTRGSKEYLNKLAVLNNKSEVVMSENFLVQNCINTMPENRTIVICDISGSGKSCTLTSLSLKIKIEFPEKFVVVINLNSIKEKLNTDQTFTPEKAVAFINKQVLKSRGVVPDIFKQCCDTNDKVIILIDGFDEISPVYEETVISLIRALMKTQIQKFIITTRPQCLKTLQSVFSTATVLHLVKFDEPTQREFVEKIWLSKITTDKIYIENEKLKKCVSTFLQQFQSDENINFENLFGTPLFLSICCELYLADVIRYIDNESELPAYSLLALYDRLFDVKVRVLIEEKFNVKDTLARQMLYETCKRKCWKDHVTLAFSELSLSNVVPEIKTSGVDDFHDVERLGLVVKLDNGQYNFIHRTFAEYFCAAELVKLYQSSKDFKFVRQLYTESYYRQEYLQLRQFVNELLGPVVP